MALRRNEARPCSPAQEAGEVADLQAGLRDVDREIDTLLRRATAGIKRLERPAA